MTLRTTSSLMAFAMVAAFSGAAQAQNQQQLSIDDDQAVQEIVDWLGEEPERIQAAMEQLQIDEATAITQLTDPLAGTYQLKSGFGKPKVTLNVMPNGDGTYTVRRVDQRRRSASNLEGRASIGKETMTGKTRLLVTFSPPAVGAAQALESLGSEVDGAIPTATYKIDPKIGRISGTFFQNEEDSWADEDDDTNTGSYEFGWRVGAEKVSFGKRFVRSAKIMAGKVKAKLGLVKNKLVSMAKNWKAAGLKVRDNLVAFARAVAAKTRELAIKAGTAVKTGAKRGWEATKKVGRSAKKHSKRAWESTKEHSKHGWEKTKKVGRSVKKHSKRAWESTKEHSKHGWTKTKKFGRDAGRAVRNGTANVMDAGGDVMDAGGRALHRGAERVRPAAETER